MKSAVRAASDRRFETVFLMGGAGLVGIQVCRQIAQTLGPKTIVVASLLEAEAREAVAKLGEECAETSFVPEWGNMFVPHALAEEPPWNLGLQPESRQAVLDATYGPFEEAYASNHLVGLIRKYRPQVIVDCVNTATGISYQNVTDGAIKVRQHLAQGELGGEAGTGDLETLLMSQSNPQLVRHVLFVYKATKEVGTSFYIKVGTTGTGGMGLNIPYTHGEDKPSATLMAKNAVGFAHTGLLFLMARTPDAPIVKEIKPAAMIGYKGVRYQPVRRKGGAFELYEPRRESLTPGGSVETREPVADYEYVAPLQTTVVDTGENGVFTRGEFAAITAMGQMEVVTPEEVAHQVVLELLGANSGKDVISALDGAVMGPTYRGGLLRQVALRDLSEIEERKDDSSVALGILGPPELSKLLYEVYLLAGTFGRTKTDIVFADPQGSVRRRPEDMAQAIGRYLESDKGRKVARMAASVGVPILLPDGRSLLRGPQLNIPQPEGNRSRFELADEASVDAWARKGWVDLRPSNMERWLARFEAMITARAQVFREGTAAVDIKTYIGGETFEIGNAVAWIFNNEMEGYRIK